MNTQDITLTILTLIVFLILYLAPMLSVGIQRIKDNWVEYRCNPMVMPFAGLFGEDPTTTFTFCIQTMMKDFMGFLLIPIQQSLNVVANLGGDITTAVNDIRKVIDAIRNFIIEIVQTIFGVFLNIMIEIQKLIIRMKDTLGKFLGVMTTLLYLLDGTVDTMQAGWSGPPGQMVRFICFDPATKLQLSSGEVREMKDLKLGDILKNGDCVEGVMQFKNTDKNGNIKEPFYTFEKGGEIGENIFVTGHHFVLKDGDFIQAKDHPSAKLSSHTSPVVYCLRTSTKKIPIGEYIFWDWDDDELTKK